MFQTKLEVGEKWISRRGFVLLAAMVVVYYASYYDTGFSLTGERGSNVLIAMRILGGERPFIDLFPGYNLLWFYPLSGLYSVVGPHWLATRIYFLVLAAVTTLMGYCLVRRVTGQAWLALVAGIFMMLMPGAIFRNYMGFIGVFGSTALLHGYVLDAGDSAKQAWRMALAGMALGVCFLIRIEPSLLLSVVWAGLAVLYPFGVRDRFGPRLRTVILGATGGLLLLGAVHAPFVFHAYQRGFGPEFTGQYTRYIGLLRWELWREWDYWTGSETNTSASTGKAPASVSRGAAGSPNAKPVAETAPSGRDGRRALVPLSDAFSGWRIHFFPAALWLPVFVAFPLVFSGISLLLLALARSDFPEKTRALVVLTTTGCALSLFPQYFFFRPDSVHLNEFLVAFWPASICSAWVLMQAARESGTHAARVWSAGIVAIVVLLFFVSFNALFGREGSGSIMGVRGADATFTAFNGVHAKVKKSELPDWQGLRDAVLGHARPGDFVVTYPYVPIVNVMCDRPTYQWSLYVDNATASASFAQNEGALLRERKPAVIVINNRAINKTEFSRFSNWASVLYDQIRHDYGLVGTFFDRVEVYALRDPGAGTSGSVSPAFR